MRAVFWGNGTALGPGILRARCAMTENRLPNAFYNYQLLQCTIQGYLSDNQFKDRDLIHVQLYFYQLYFYFQKRTGLIL